MMNKSSFEVVNPLVLVLYLYQYGLMVPFLIFFNSQVPIALFTLFLLSILFIKKGYRINIKVLFLVFIPLLLIILKTILTPIQYGEDNTLEIIQNFLLIGISGILVGSVQFCPVHFLRYGIIIGWLNFLILFLVPFRGIDSVNYMRFGYAMLPTVFFACYGFFSRIHSKINLLIILVSSLEVVIFGARGATLAILFFLMLMICILVKDYKYTRYCLILLTLGLLYFSEKIILAITSLLDSTGYTSYAITKLAHLLQDEGDLESISSGRFDIYEIGFQLLGKSPILGAPLNSALRYTGFSYFHNIFLDIAVNFGVVVFIIFIMFMCWSFVKMLKSRNVDLKWIYCILFTLAFVRLFVSSVLWQRPEFWMFLSFYINSKLLGLKTTSTHPIIRII